MIVVNIKVSGLAKARYLLGRLQADNGIVKAFSKIAPKLKRLIKAKVPYRSGTSRNAVDHKIRVYKNGAVMLVGIKSKQVGSFEGKKVVSHKIGHFYTKKRAAFKQRVLLTTGKVLVMYRKLVRGRQVGFFAIKNNGMARVLERKVGENKPVDIFKNAVTYAKSNLSSIYRKVMKL